MPHRHSNPPRPNDLLDQVHALTRPGAIGEAQYGSSGVSFHQPPLLGLALFELTAAMVYPDLETAASGHLDRDPTPSALAKMLWCHQHDAADQTSGGTAVRSYGGTDHSREETIWHPAAWRNAEGYAYGTPTLGPGDRAWCVWNRQSGRWEILAPPLNVLLVELGETFMPGDASVQVGMVGDDSDWSFTAYCEGPYHLGIGRGGGAAHAGSLAYVLWSPVRRRWELLAGQFKVVAEGKAYETIAAGASGQVAIWWLDYETESLVDSGQRVTALNWLHPTIASGKRVVVSYERQENRWTVIAAEA